MAFFYAASVRALFDDTYNQSIPADAKPITVERYEELLAAQSLGKIIVPGAGGFPEAMDLPMATPAQLRESVIEQRRAAYKAESDPLKIEAEYDAQITGGEPDYSAWLAKVAEIKARYPLPE